MAMMVFTTEAGSCGLPTLAEGSYFACARAARGGQARMRVSGPAALRLVFQIQVQVLGHAIFVAGSVIKHRKIQMRVGKRRRQLYRLFEVINRAAPVAQFQTRSPN